MNYGEVSYICSFLSEECQEKKLSAQARKQANALIQRSKVQLQDMERIVPRPVENDEAYVDMQKSKEVPSPVVVEQPLPSEPIVKCPYAELPAGFLTNDSKKGYLLWKTRFLLHFDKVKNIYAGIHFDWLLLYGNNRDSKPFCTLDLRSCTAKNLHSDRNSRFEFELVHSGTKKKAYNFIAQTRKDLLQWVARINKMKETPSIIIPDPPSEEEEETYDTVQTPVEEVINVNVDTETVDENGEPFYDIVMAPTKPESKKIENSKNRNSKSEKPPPLPPCRNINVASGLLAPPREPGIWEKHQKPASPISLKEVKEREHLQEERRSSDTESVIEYADPEGETASISTDNSFSDDDEAENDYYVFAPKNPEPVTTNGLRKALSEESVEYDCVMSVKSVNTNKESEIMQDNKDEDSSEEIYCVLVTPEKRYEK